MPLKICSLCIMMLLVLESACSTNMGSHCKDTELVDVITLDYKPKKGGGLRFVLCERGADVTIQVYTNQINCVRIIAIRGNEIVGVDEHKSYKNCKVSKLFVEEMGVVISYAIFAENKPKRCLSFLKKDGNKIVPLFRLFECLGGNSFDVLQAEFRFDDFYSDLRKAFETENLIATDLDYVNGLVKDPVTRHWRKTLYMDDEKMIQIRGRAGVVSGQTDKRENAGGEKGAELRADSF